MAVRCHPRPSSSFPSLRRRRHFRYSVAAANFFVLHSRGRWFFYFAQHSVHHLLFFLYHFYFCHYSPRPPLPPPHHHSYQTLRRQTPSQQQCLLWKSAPVSSTDQRSKCHPGLASNREDPLHIRDLFPPLAVASTAPAGV